MKQSLQLKLGQQLTMTPQLQQAIKLLQLSTLDLQQEIQSALDSNPMLEVGEDAEDEAGANGAAPPEAAAPSSHDNGIDSGASEAGEIQDVASEWSENIPEDLPVDTRWDDVYQTTGTTSSSSGNGEDSDFDLDARNSSAGEPVLVPVIF